MLLCLWEQALDGYRLCLALSVVAKPGEMAANDRERLETTGSVCLGFKGVCCRQEPQCYVPPQSGCHAPVCVSEMI